MGRARRASSARSARIWAASSAIEPCSIAGSRLRLDLSSVRRVRTSRRVARRRRRAPVYSSHARAKLATLVRPPFPVRGEHRADAAGLRVDVGADDDPVGVDAAQHRLLGVARKPLDGDAQAARGVAAVTSHRKNGARGGAVSQRGERGRKAICRFLVAAFGDAGHAFPAIGWRGRSPREGTRWWSKPGAVAGAGGGRRPGVHRGGGVQDVPLPPGSGEGPSAADAALALLLMLERERFDVVVSDILTVAPALAAERAGLRRATLIPHVYPVHEDGMPFFAFGAQPPRTPVGRALWRRALPVLVGGLRRGGRDERFAVGGGAAAARSVSRRHLRPAGAGGDVSAARISAAVARGGAADGADRLRAAASRRRRPPAMRRWCWWRRRRRRIRSAGWCARRSRRSPTSRCACWRQLIGSGRRSGCRPRRRTSVDWLSYSQAMPLADLVVCHGGHGTVARAFSAGVRCSAARRWATWPRTRRGWRGRAPG